jgi:hypothetical protein
MDEDPMTADHRLNTELLNAELPDRRFDGPDYLEWLYDENPDGSGFTGQRDDDDVRVAHYALVPQRYRSADGPGSFVFSLNAVSRSGSQRKGYFVEIGQEIFAKAAAEGRIAITAVANEKSTPGAVKYLGYRMLGPMPVAVTIANPLRARDWRSVAVTDEWLGSDEFAALADELDDHEAVGWMPSWQADNLRWRLARPRGGYVVHIGPDLVAVSTRDSVRGLPFAVILKLLPRRGETECSGRDAVASAARHHRTPVCVYAGLNAHVGIRGLPLPARLRPAPLNLLVRSLNDDVDQDVLALDTFEFLDCDAY